MWVSLVIIHLQPGFSVNYKPCILGYIYDLWKASYVCAKPQKWEPMDDNGPQSLDPLRSLKPPTKKCFLLRSFHQTTTHMGFKQHIRDLTKKQNHLYQSVLVGNCRQTKHTLNLKEVIPKRFKPKQLNCLHFPASYPGRMSYVYNGLIMLVFRSIFDCQGG